MNIHATDINVPMPHIVSNSPTHSLPDVSYSGSEAIGSTSATGKTTETTSNKVPEVGVAASPEHCAEGFPLGEFASSDAIALPVLQRAISTSPRLEHTSDETRATEGAGFAQNGSADPLQFFPLLDTSLDADKSVSLSSGCLHQQNGGVDAARNDVRASDTVLATAATSSKQSDSPSLGRLRSGLRRMMRIKSQPSGNPDAAAARRSSARKDSTVSSRSGTGHPYGSSIFGSKLFESGSTSSFGSQRIHVVADSPSIEPGFISCYSASCDGASFPTLESRGRAWREGSRFRTTSASSNLESTRPCSGSGENVSLQRTRSLPSRHAASTPGEFLHDEVCLHYTAPCQKLQNISGCLEGTVTRQVAPLRRTLPFLPNTNVLAADLPSSMACWL